MIVTLVWCAFGTFLCLKIIEAMSGLRVSKDQEREGLDVSLHGESLHQ